MMRYVSSFIRRCIYVEDNISVFIPYDNITDDVTALRIRIPRTVSCQDCDEFTVLKRTEQTPVIWKCKKESCRSSISNRCCGVAKHYL